MGKNGQNGKKVPPKIPFLSHFLASFSTFFSHSSSDLIHFPATFSLSLGRNQSVAGIARCEKYRCWSSKNLSRFAVPEYPKDPAVLKTLRDSELLRRSHLTTPPDLLRWERFFERKNVCNSQENGVRTRCAAIANHYAIVNLLRRANLLRRSIFSTAGSFG